MGAMCLNWYSRKPQQGDKRTGGNCLMHLLAGSHVLTSVPRSIFVMVRSTSEETDSSLVRFLQRSFCSFGGRCVFTASELHFPVDFSAAGANATTVASGGSCVIARLGNKVGNVYRPPGGDLT
jgi:hypothetical protein